MPAWIISWPVCKLYWLWHLPRTAPHFRTLRDPRRLWHWSVSFSTVRTVALAALIAGVSPGSAALPMSILLVLMLSLGIHVRVMPYRVVFDNAMETLLIGEAILVYLAELITLMWSDAQSQMLFTAILVADLVFRVGVYLFIAAHVFSWVHQGANRTYVWLARRLSDREDQQPPGDQSRLQPLLDSALRKE